MDNILLSYNKASNFSILYNISYAEIVKSPNPIKNDKIKNNKSTKNVQIASKDIYNLENIRIYLTNNDDPDAAEEDYYNLQSFHKKTLLMYFWSSWCIECMEGLKDLSYLKQNLILNKVSNIEIIPISIDFKNTSFVKLIYKKNNISNLMLFFDRYKYTSNALNVTNLPATFIIGENEKVLYRFTKNINWGSKEFYETLINISQNNSDTDNIDFTKLEQIDKENANNQIMTEKEQNIEPEKIIVIR